jgi:acyl-coenzyme A thioesterase PaaI-like protein
MAASERGPVSTARLAEQLGDQLPTAASVPPEAIDLVERVRELVAAVVMTDVDPDDRAAAAAQIAAITSALQSRQRDQALFLVRHADGRVESLVQAGSGRLNPQAPPIEWIHRPTEPPAGSDPVPVEVSARCTFTAAHCGSPGRVHGGVIAVVLDEALGGAVTAAGASGMTVAFTLSLRRAIPIGVPVDISGRFTGSAGRKSFASGEARVGGTVAAEATAIYVQERRDA